MQAEQLEIVNEQGQTIGVAPRSKFHGNPSLLHKVVHVIVVNKAGDLLLQKRSLDKDVAPGLWDTSVGGHIEAGEDIEDALTREMAEELGIECDKPTFLYSYIHSNPYESELVYTYKCIHEGPFEFNRAEIEEVRFWSISEIESTLHSGTLSDNFKSEFYYYLGYLKKDNPPH